MYKLSLVFVKTLLTIALFAWLSGSRADPAPNVVVSIPPVHSLVAAVMEGVASPDLLVPAGASPHAFALRPSDMRSLHAADLVVWIGESLERFLAKPLAMLDQTTERITVAKVPKIKLLNSRQRGGWSDSGHAETGHVHAIDPHLWLDPDNARVIVTQVAQHLMQIDPANARRYMANAEQTWRRLMSLDVRLRRRLKPVTDVPYVVFHDAYQYFEKHYGLEYTGSITTSPELSPGARRIIDIRELVRTQDVRCVFSEPQFTPALVQTVLEDTGARPGVLDPEGADLPPSADAYFMLMKRLADSFVNCLGLK
jgi:zinc transport system substrate-binding protein